MWSFFSCCKEKRWVFSVSPSLVENAVVFSRRCCNSRGSSTLVILTLVISTPKELTFDWRVRSISLAKSLRKSFTCQVAIDSG